MLRQSEAARRRMLVWLMLLGGAGLERGGAAAGGADSGGTNQVEVLAIQGIVEVARGGQPVWDPASTRPPYAVLRPGDRIRTLAHSRAAIRLRDRTVVQLGPHGVLEVLLPRDGQPGFSLTAGRLYLFHRDKPGEFLLRTPLASPVIRGTEFVLEVAADGRARLELVEGEAGLTNAFGALDLKAGQAALVEADRAPRAVAPRPLATAVQWCLWYPAVIEADECGFDVALVPELARSLAAYRQGDFLGALAAYPGAREPLTDGERVYVAALRLAVSDVPAAEELLETVRDPLGSGTRLATALRVLVAAVKREHPASDGPGAAGVSSASLQLAFSYARQSRGDLDGARGHARAAVGLAPQSGFTWARLAELEFSFGQTAAAIAAVDRALERAPRYAPARALRGFLAAAEGRYGAAGAEFEAALAIDGALGNAWLGRGLCRMQRGGTRAGLSDLLVAAALEPNRALLRSYLGKAFAEDGDAADARRELALAMRLDPGDPTAWLYRALLEQSGNRLNDAVRDFEGSKERNDNRAVYRSRFLLDQDRAVRQANLAAAFRDVGMAEEGVREAAAAISSDYANPSAHLFLANSYAELRDPNGVTLRYETAALSEYLVANLLSPVGGAALSPFLSQQEYSPLFDRRGLGLSSSTEYLSRGDWRQQAGQYGAFGGTAYALDVYDQTQPGDGPNQDLSLLAYSGTVHQRVGARDTLFLRASAQELDAGDVRPYADPAAASRGLRVEERLAPALLAGVHHEWGPGSHTLFLAGWLQDDFLLSDPGAYVPTLRRDRLGVFGAIPPPLSRFDLRQEARASTVSAEAQQVWETSRQTLAAGVRYQDGRVGTEFTLDKVPPSFANLEYPAGSSETDSVFRRASAYAYEHWRALDGLWLVAGLAYDWLVLPNNVDLPPVTSDRREEYQLSPKGGLVWQPLPNTTVRAAYTQSLGGLYHDQSVRLEPTQVAGFNQAFRSVIPESVAGLTPGAGHETWGGDLSHRLARNTYLGLNAEWLRSEVDRGVGVFLSSPGNPQAVPASTVERLEFDERSFAASAHQLLGRDWALGVRYRWSEACLERRWPEVPPEALRTADQSDTSRLQEVGFSVHFSHPSGFFGQALARWFAQENHGNAGALPGDDFWQYDVFVGYRFARRRAEVRIGGLNLSGQDYRLYPLNLYPQLPRDRTLYVGFKFSL